MRGFRTFLIIATLLLLPALVSCGPGGEPKPVKIGFIAVTSGELFRLGRDTFEVAKFAAGEINKEGGVLIDGERHRLEIVFRDSRYNPDIACQEAVNLIEKEKVSAIVGPLYSLAAIPVAKICEREQIPMVTPYSTFNDLTKNRQYVFRIAFHNGFQGRALARFALKDLGRKKAAVLYDTKNPAVSELVDNFSAAYIKQGGEIDYSHAYPENARGFASQMRDISQTKADLLFLPNNTKDVILQVRQARAAGFNGTILCGDNTDIREVGRLNAFQGVYVTNHWLREAKRPSFEEVMNRYEQTGLTMTEIGALTYDAIQLLVSAMEKANSAKPQDVRDGIIAMEPIQGATGDFDFIDSGNPLTSAYIGKIEKDGVKFVKELRPKQP